MFIAIEGPEKAGKSTLASVLKRKYGAVIRKWGPIPEHNAYCQPLKEDLGLAATGRLIVWDRAWASEHVYAKLMDRNRALRNDPWLGEWTHGRAADAVGIKVILLGPTDICQVIDKRDETDLPCDPYQERQLFMDYGLKYGWKVISDERTQAPELLADYLYTHACRRFESRAALPPGYTGPGDADIVVLTDRVETQHVPVDSWLPFSSIYGERFARALGDDALSVGWAVAGQVNAATLRQRKLIVTCGDWPALWAKYNLFPHVEIFNAPHLRRMGAADRSQIANKIRDYLRRHISGSQARTSNRVVNWPILPQGTSG